MLAEPPSTPSQFGTFSFVVAQDLEATVRNCPAMLQSAMATMILEASYKCLSVKETANALPSKSDECTCISCHFVVEIAPCWSTLVMSCLHSMALVVSFFSKGRGKVQSRRTQHPKGACAPDLVASAGVAGVANSGVSPRQKAERRRSGKRTPRAAPSSPGGSSGSSSCRPAVRPAGGDAPGNV